MVPQISEEDSHSCPETTDSARSLRLTSGVLKYPSRRDEAFKNPQIWLDGKRKDDGVHPFWRIHDKLYDLSDFMDKHPGGKFWLEVTRGTDITESFESSHFGSLPEQLLKKYYVKDASTPRTTSFTFHDEGFYKTLKRKAIPILRRVGTGPSREMLLIQDSLLTGFLVFGGVACLWTSDLCAVIAGIFMSLMATAAHNFFHQKDNWRMYLFDLTMFSSRDWRISHALSHHNYPNTIIDYEISSFEPHFEMLPKADKWALHRYYGVVVTSSLVFTLAVIFDTINKFVLFLKGEIVAHIQDAFPIMELVLAVALSGSLQQGLRVWIIVHGVGSAFFVFSGIVAAHHHPEIYHEGDVPPPDRDWGLHQVSATRERGELFVSSVFLASVSFGNHTLHHLFPTVDHSKLPYLMDAFLDTCADFGIKFDVYTPWKHFVGFYHQLARTKGNRNEPTILK